MGIIFNYKIWFLIGSQNLYGKHLLKQVKNNSENVVVQLNEKAKLPCVLILKKIVTTQEDITRMCQEANNDNTCAGIIVWLHTFSPAKMWINGLTILNKPLLQFHTQFNSSLPWDSIDMDFMNLNQTAHGGREFGFIGARMRLSHSIIAGHWRDKETHYRLNRWIRQAISKQETRHLKVARFGDNMRDVAVTEGDKVTAQIKFGFSVNTWPVGDLAEIVKDVQKQDINDLVEEYENDYTLSSELLDKGKHRLNLLDAARIEIGIKRFLEERNFSAFTTNFEDLHGLKQLPGLAVQRLMEQGYGFAGEGDWKTAALLRIIKTMSLGLPGGTSFIEDYTYHLENNQHLVLGSHMLEVCPSIKSPEKKARLKVCPLNIGNKADPARLIFDAKPGQGLLISMIDLGGRFRLLVNVIEIIAPLKSMSKLPVARAVWRVYPDFKTATESWIIAGGGHHSILSQALTLDDMNYFSELYNIELIVIDQNTNITSLKNTLRWNEYHYNK